MSLLNKLRSHKFMKYLKYINILIILFLIPVTKASSFEIKKEFEEWLSKGSNTDKIQFRKLDELISSADVYLGSEDDDTFSVDMFELNLKSVEYSMTQDLDGDGVQEIIVLFIQGSGRYPYFYILKKSTEDTKYRISVFLERYIEPAFLKKEIYFIETIYDFNSGRKLQFNVIKFDKKLKPNIVMIFINNYEYELSEKISQYISNDIINNIAAFDYSFLGQNGLDEFTLNNMEYTLHAKINWTSVGYMSTSIDIKATNINGNTKEFKKIWGFNVKRINGFDYLCVLDMGGNNVITTITNFRATVYKLCDWSVVASEYIYAAEKLGK